MPAAEPAVLIDAGYGAQGVQAAQGPAGYPGHGSPANAAPASQQAPAWGRLPQELRALPQWLLAGPNETGELKVPLGVNAAGKTFNASDTTPSHWMPFDAAVYHAERLGLGIGFVLTAQDPFFCESPRNP